MDYKRLTIAAVVAWFVDMLYAIGVWMMLLGDELAKYPAVFRSQGAMNANMPLMLAGALLGMFALTYIYAKGYEGKSGLQEGLRFGLVLALFTLGYVTIGMYGAINIDDRLAVISAIVSFVEMIVVGVTIGAVYRPAVLPQPTARATMSA